MRLAVAQPLCAPGDVVRNVAAHAEAVQRAHSRVVVFPELSLTGYVLDVPPVDLDAGALSELVDACGRTSSVALVGAPVRDGAGRSFIATVAVSAVGADVIYRKVHLGGDEPTMFTGGSEAAMVEVDGWRIGLGICRDTGILDHVDQTADLGIDLYVAGLVHAPEELAEQDARGLRIATRIGVPVAFASAAGPVGPAYSETAGHSTIWSTEGTNLARAGDETGEIATTVLER
jgi:predicted amidohydrolase